MTLTKEQFYARHSNSAKWLALDKKQKEDRWKSYLAGTSDKALVPAKATKKIGSPSGGSMKGKTAYQSAALSAGYKLGPHTHDFLTARFNPFCPRLTQVGYPTSATGGTVKVRGFARGSLVCNAAGYGCIMAAPGPCAVTTTGNGYICYSGVSSAYAQATDGFPASNSALGMVSTQFAGMPFAQAGTAAFTTWARIVGFGIRIRNTSPILTKGGSCKSITFPLLSDMFSLSGSQMLVNFPKYTGWYDLADPETPWLSAVWSPVAGSDMAVPFTTYNASRVDGQWYDISNVNTYNDEYTVGLCISGAANGTFDFEVVGFYEFFGPPSLANVNSAINTLMTPCYPDPLGVSIITSSMVDTPNAMPRAADGGVDLPSIFDSIGTAARTVLGNVNASDILGSLLPSAAPEVGMSLPSVGTTSLQGWAADSSSGVLADLESRFSALAGREVGSAIPEVASAMLAL